jgi:hypothetical protein
MSDYCYYYVNSLTMSTKVPEIGWFSYVVVLVDIHRVFNLNFVLICYGGVRAGQGRAREDTEPR